ncbi:uncharacterized protein Kmr isoform X3 [Diachasmimorpha longicaudata]|uniref:uncharacterized protein Kmr isoform X3 n=2 Tax=Diachasmimorpha longicaudata TaxID=58733 RepID=UPI0030B8A77F
MRNKTEEDTTGDSRIASQVHACAGLTTKFASSLKNDDHAVAPCHLPGSLRGPLSNCNNNYPPGQGHSHEPPLRHTPSRTGYPTAPHGCALHSRLDQPVTASTPGMDDKKVVQTAPTPGTGQPQRPKSSLDTSGVVASISGVRRRSGPQGLRSPAAKRPLSAPVALQGWLHKQGSEGLMLWKKRWFVLSEYCLFYYKGPEEEKLLGSILLPSYRVTACKPEDKVNKKFAFKAEHANMRTYHFAADTREGMNQWVNALTLASLLQDPNPNAGEPVAIELADPADGDRSARPSVSSISSILNQSADDSDSGFHGFQSRDDPSQSNNNSSPNSINTASFPNLSASNSNHGNVNNHSPEKAFDESHPQPMVNGWMQPPSQFSQPSTSQHYGHIQSPGHSQHQQHQAMMQQYMTRQQMQPGPSNVQTVQPMPRNFGQPVYANAPPKPRRLTDGSTDYSTPSPDPDYRKSPVQPSVRMTAKSPISEYDRGNAIYASRLAQQQNTPTLRTDKSGLNYGYGQTQAAERRTPDTYGRSAQPRVARGNGDYEDVYAGPQLYQRPAGPVGYTKGPAPVPISIPIYAVQAQGCPNTVTVNGPVMRQQRVQPPPRPHSADFLEYEATRRPSSHTTDQPGVQHQQRRPQRPKSSLDVVPSSEITSPKGDGYFYSEERYAAQMRQSAVYLHQTPQQHQQQRNQSLARATTPSKSSPRVEESNGPSVMNESSCAVRRPQREIVYRQHAMATQSLQRYAESTSNTEAMMRRSLRERSYDSSYRDTLVHGDSGTVPRRVPRDYESPQTTPNNRLVDVSYGSHSYHGEHGSRRYSDQQFARSASARLPRTRHSALDNTDDDDYSDRAVGQGSRDGERRIQQREESMKRLLEWKQRMLQSPLTRKPSGATNGVTTAQSELSSYYKRQALLDLAAHEASVAEARHSRRRDDNSHRPHTRSKSTDGRRSVANVSRYNSYSSDDEELDDVRRKRTRRPSHAGRSPRHSDENNPALQCHPTVTFSSAIPPDAGYEEVSFPPQEPAASKNQSPMENLTVKTPKKPGILKTPSSCHHRQSGKSEGGRLSTLAGETWQTTKNVQWDSTENKENWDSRIDESKVIKEFSYQYIKADEIGDIENENWEGNLVQSRIKSFECSIEDGSPIKEMLSMQEPLKVSPPQATEAHVSRLDSTRAPPMIRKFALTDNTCKSPELSPEESLDQKNDSGKSVKDLLADFERKSQQVCHQQNNKRDEIKDRGVFSDTETLLYDTGSDLDQPHKSEEEIESDQVFEYKEIPTGTIKRKNLEKKIDMTEEIKTSLNDSQVAIEGLSENADAFARLSMTESMVTHGDNLSGESNSSTPKIDDINPEEHYLPMSPRKAILDPSNDDRTDSKMMESLFANLRHEESSYVEMTQNGRGHSLLAPSGDTKLDSGDYSTLEASHYEFVCVADNKVEPVYMEVSQLGEQDKKKSQITRKKDGSNGPMRGDLPDILTALKSDSSDADDESSKDLDSIDAPRHPRFSLSDTFRPASYYLSASRTIIAEMQDSSDSELVSPPPIPTSPPPLDDLETLEMQETLELKKSSPQVPVNRDSRLHNNPETHRPPSRFSDDTISSTFRDSRISLESASGSDTQELRNSEEEERHRRMKRRPVSDGVCEVFDSLDELESLGNRFDGTSIDLDQYLEELQARDAFNVDLYSKDLSYNSIYGFNENMLITDKVHKTSNDIAKMNVSSNTLDRPFNYNSRTKTSSASSLPSMRVSDAPPSHQHSQSFTGDIHYENVSFSPLNGSPAICHEQEPNREDLRIKSRPQLSHSRDSSYSIISSSGPVASPTPSTMLPQMSYGHRNPSPYHDQRPHHHSRSASQDSTRYSLSPNRRSSSSQDFNHVASTSAGKTSAQVAALRNSPAVHPGHNPGNDQADNDNDQTGAPYYYSDLQAGVNSIDAQSRSVQTFIAHTSRLPQLNNQRGDSNALNKRNDIGRLVNPIVRQIPRRTEVDGIDEARRIAAELRKNSSQYLVDNKSGLVDKRNVYEADTLRRVKSIEPLPDVSLPDVSNVNLYPQGLRDKSGSQTQLAADEIQGFMQFPQPTHRRSRSLEGLLDDVGLQNLVEQRNRDNRENRVSSVPPTRMREEDEESATSTFIRINSDEPFQGEDTWEQDTLWRESLRRVSLRHARSLDNLDAPAVRPSGTTGSETPDARGRSKITRGATYVNDSVALQRLSSPVNVQERPRLVRRAGVDGNQGQDDDGAYESLAMDRSTGGYIWDPENEAYKRQTDKTNHFLDEGNLPPVQQPNRRSFELDREKLRQWDLMSSACLLQEQQRTSMAESGRGLPVSGRGEEGMSIMMRMIMEEERRQDQEVAECVGNVEGIGERVRNDEEKDNDRASGSGSVIGRDPLPPRAVSTSQLSQTPLTQPPASVSTLPLPRANGRQQISGGLPVHQSTPQPTSVRLPATGGNDSDSSICRDTSIADVRPSSSMVNNETARISSPSDTAQRLVSPARNLRVVSPIDHRVSSPSDSERHMHSPSERLMTSPVSIREMNGDAAVHRQIPRVVQGRESTTELLQKRPILSNARGREILLHDSFTGDSCLGQLSAGELLGRTHEELVLLLIQLRRQSAAICKAMETCHMEIEAQVLISARLVELDQPRRLENLQKLDELKKHLMDLEKQYEKGKPLVNLVDNMVKLGTLYNRNGVNGSVAGSRQELMQMQEVTREQRERLEYNQRVQEQRIMAEERRDWERLSPDHGQLQAKVQQLYKLDRLLQEESGTLHSLQQDKELLEKALGGLKYKLQGSRTNPAEVEKYKKQQILLERELARVRMLLAHNSKKLEETVAENARLEQDLVVLRQKLQASRRYAGNMTRDTSGTTVALETELRRVQQLVGDLQRQRQELSVQVRQLTEKSHSLVQQIRPNQQQAVSPAPQIYHPKKKTQSSWLETDLDSGMTLDHGLDSPSSSSSSMSPRTRQNGSPHQHIPSPQYKDPPPARYSPTSANRPAQPTNLGQSGRCQSYHRDTQQNHITAISPQLREQIQQHQLKQQLLKDQMQGKGSPIQSNVPLYVNTDSRRINSSDGMKRIDSGVNGMSILPPEYVPPPPPPPCEEALMVNGGYGHDDNKFAGLLPNREKQEIKTVRIVKRESERRQRDRGDRNGNIGIPMTNGLQAPGGAKRLGEDEFGSQQFEKAQLGRVVEESPLVHAQSTVQLSELDDVQFQRSMSLPRGFGGQRPQPGVHNGPVPPPPRSDSMNALRNMMARRHRVRFENQEGSSDSTLSPHTESPTSSSHLPMSSPNYSSPSYSPSHQNYSSAYPRMTNAQSVPYIPYPVGSISSGRTDSVSSPISPISPALTSPVPVPSAQERLSGSAVSINSVNESPQLSPVFKSEAAKQIIKEMTEKRSDGPRRRQVPKEKRRHYTVSSSKPMLDLEDTFSKMGMGRARDDLDMERALRPRINAPDVVRSTLSHKELKYNESTIDQLLGTPNKIFIPERYIPEQTPELSAEEKKQRLKKADAIRKMLSETTVTTPEGDDENVDIEKSNTLKKKVAEEKRQRDHILQLNQILAKQVMEKSKMVAVKALATLPLNTEPSFDDEDLSPVTPLPLYQQRENFYS